MSYSFHIHADTKDEAGVKVEAELAQVVLAQPSHAADRQAAQDAAEAFIDVLAEPGDDEQISVYIVGSLGWRGDNDFTSASVTVNVAVSAKAAAPANQIETV